MMPQSSDPVKNFYFKILQTAMTLRIDAAPIALRRELMQLSREVRPLLLSSRTKGLTAEQRAIFTKLENRLSSLRIGAISDQNIPVHTYVEHLTSYADALILQTESEEETGIAALEASKHLLALLKEKTGDNHQSKIEAAVIKLQELQGILAYLFERNEEDFFLGSVSWHR